MSIPTQHNEFSRPIETDDILKTASGNKRRIRDYTLTITANEDECLALAKRFELKSLQALEANLSVRPSDSHSRSRGFMTCNVEGTINASLTQTCVRTNEDFPVDVEFLVQSIVKPTANNFYVDENEEVSNSFKKSSKDVKNLKSNQLKNMNNMLELQNMLDQIKDEDDDLLVEDESIYSLLTGTLDVGELVAQSFWLQLDPYPHKPGSEPVEISISG
jgi:uncharacterized metal-binding protein YceD (DUF177 family)